MIFSSALAALRACSGVIGVLVLTSATALAAPAPDAAFQRAFGEHFFSDWWRLYPDSAIENGYYKGADRLVVPDERARADELEHVGRWLEQLHRIDPKSLSPPVRADWVLLDNQFKSTQWELTQLRDWQWDPSLYNVADPFALLLATDYAPVEQRLRTVMKRLEKVPDYYAAAQRNVKDPTPEHVDLAIQQNRGALGVFGDGLAKQIQASMLSAAERSVFDRRITAARAAISGYVSWLEALQKKMAATLRPAGPHDFGAAAGRVRSFRIGRELYEQEFAFQIQSGESAAALYHRAQQEKERLLERMGLLAQLLWPKYFPNEAPPGDRQELTARVIAEISKQHATPADFVPEVKRLIPQLEDWVNEHGLLEVDRSKPLVVRDTPEYKRGVAGGSLDPPGPYNPGAQSYFNIDPFSELTAEQAESFLREYNRWMLPIFVIHETVPGHYVQLMYSNRSASLIKSVFGNGATIEGWAVYGERMMMESGYGGESAEQWLIYWKWNLRSVCNTILDYGVHVLGMSEAEARQLLVHDAFQGEQELREKWHRVKVTSVQLDMYFAGYSAIYDFRERLKKQQGRAFDLKSFHERFLSFGSAPVPLIEEMMTASQ
ncbi:MAG TPA: DUF885 domain-containing protein [Steroidobacteraceae bacterium]|nr:DUF885 domain-containing protein [Steroidobacteraceae bacterium]